MATHIHLPNDWFARAYQQPFYRAIQSGVKRAVAVWHRRSGKDSCALNLTATQSQKRVALYWHCFPTATQGRKALWDGIDGRGRRILDQAFPKEMRVSTNEQEMRIKFKNGSVWQIVGSDNYDSLVGTNVAGIVFSEWSLCKPAAWDYFRPILNENDGWAVFIYTPRGRNHGYHLYELARKHPKWHASLLTVNDTEKPGIGHNGGPLLDEYDEPVMVPVVAEASIQEDRDMGMSDARINQEYYCSFDAEVEGAYFGKIMADLRAADRIGKIDYDPSLTLETWWDLGMDDSMSIVFVQPVGAFYHVINYVEGSGEGIGYYARVLGELAKEHGYTYTRHLAPHDLSVREIGTGVSRKKSAMAHGIRFEIVPRIAKFEDGIEALRAMLPAMYMDEDKCSTLIEAASLYRRKYDEEARVYDTHPVRDWTTHPIDALRTGAQSRRGGKKRAVRAAATALG